MALLFNGNTPKKIIYNGFNLAKVIYNGVVVWLAKILTTITGKPPLTLPNSTGENLVNYEIYGNSVQRKLPEGYTELEYIENTGNEYIDVGFIPNQGTRVVMDFQLTSSATTGYALFGVRVSTNSKGFTFQKISNGYWGGMYGDTLINGNTVQFNTYRHIVDKNKNIVYLDGTSIMSFSSSVFTCTRNMYLFGMNNNGEATIATQPIRVFSCKIYDNGTLVRDFIPCKNTLNEIGLFDTVNNKFYENAGTGTFTAGTEIKLPDGYTRISYIEADGNQYLDTGIVPDANTQVDYKVRFKTDALDASPLMGVRLGTSNNNRYFPIAYNVPNTDYRSSYGLATGVVDAIDFNIDYEGSFQPQNSVSIINGTSYSLSGHNFRKDSNYNMYLFATLGYSGGNLYQSSGMIYYCKMIKNNNLLRYFIPCIDNQGVVGMYDLISKAFFSSETSTGFIAGAETPNPSDKIEIRSVGENETGLPVGYKQLDYIQATGGQYIDTNYLGNLNTRIVLDFDFTLTSSSDAFSIFGSRTGASNPDNIGVIRGSQSGVYGLVVDFGNYSSYRAFYATSDANTRYKVDLGKDGRYIYDSQGNVLASNTTVNTATFTSANSLLLFKQYNAPSATGDYAGKIYSCKIYEDDTMVRNFVPCISDTNAVGMYDLVNKVFYQNEGTGSFTAGNEIAKGGYKIPVRVSTANLPNGYTQLDYVQSTGEQYIDTNYVPNAQTKIQAVVAFTEDTGTMQNYGAIANLGTSSKVNYARWHFGIFQNKLCAFRENTTQSGDIKIDYDDAFHTYEITNTSCSLDDISAETDKYTNSNITFTLFARNGYTTAGGTASITAYSKSKLKSLKIYENNVLIRDFIPCKDPNNIIGLYDVVNDIFYVNQGTGDFIAGNTVSTIINIYLSEPLRKIGNADAVKLPSGYTQVEYVESTGTQYINTGLKISTKTKLEMVYEPTASGWIYGYKIATQGSYSASALGTAGTATVDYFGDRATNVNVGTGKITLTIDANKVYSNNNLVYTHPEVAYDESPSNFYLMSTNIEGSTVTQGQGRLYGAKIYNDNGVLVRNFVPCINNQNEIGMYDLVNGQFYPNSGTGTFIAGSPVYADYLDFENQKVYRQVGQHSLVGYTFSQTASADYGDYFGNSQAPTELNIRKSVDSNDTNKYVFANFAKGVNVVDRVNFVNTVRVYMTTTNFVVRNSINQEFTSAANLQSFLSDESKYIMYVLATPTEEAITLPDILTNAGTNIIEVDTSIQPSNMSVDYWQEGS